MPTEGQILRAKIMAAGEAYEKKHRKPLAGGFSVPSRDKTYNYLSKMFGLPTHEISRFMTYARSCTHEWSEGACERCPE
jgi:hypothetical protein